MSSATKAPGAEGPGDWVLVPREPTDEMIFAAAGVRPGDLSYPAKAHMLCFDYRAMIASAPTPTDRVGEDVGRGFTFEQPQRGRMFDVLRRLGQAAINLQKITDHEMAHMAQSRCLDDIEALVAEALAAKEPVGWSWDEIGIRLRNCSIHSIAGGEPERYLIKIGCPDIQTMQAVRDGMVQLREADPAALPRAPAPSDPAGAGGDLGELERLSKAAPFPIELRRGCLEVKTEPHRTNNGYLGKEMAEYVFALVNAHRSGQLVASTPGQKGAGGEKTGASFGPGSREPGPLVPAFGFDPSRVERAAQAAWEHQGDKIDPASPEANETWATTNESARNLWRSIAEVMLTAANGDHHGR